MARWLNPVAVLISKALVEIPPKFTGMPPVNPACDPHKRWKGAQGLAEDVRHYGQWMRDEAEKRIGHLYPQVDCGLWGSYKRRSLGLGRGSIDCGHKQIDAFSYFLRKIFSPKGVCIASQICRHILFLKHRPVEVLWEPRDLLVVVQYALEPWHTRHILDCFRRPDTPFK